MYKSLQFSIILCIEEERTKLFHKHKYIIYLYKRLIYGLNSGLPG